MRGKTPTLAYVAGMFARCVKAHTSEGPRGGDRPSGIFAKLTMLHLYFVANVRVSIHITRDLLPLCRSFGAFEG